VASPATGINAVLGTATSISGTVTSKTGGADLSGICVDAYEPGSNVITSGAITASDGTYTISGLAPGSYDVDFFTASYCGGPFNPQWYNNTAQGAVSQSGAVAVAVTVASPATGINAVLTTEVGALLPNTTLSANQSLFSPDGQFKLVMQGDGNLVEYEGSTSIWASGTSGTGNYAVMQGDGNLVVYSSTNAVKWASGTSGNAGAFLQLADGGVLSVQAVNGGPLWTA
jgi:Carboxypeptidase regulatory-like domain